MKRITFLFALLLAFVGATQMRAETVTYGNTFTKNQTINVSSTAATSLSTDTWYVIKNVNKGFWQDQSSGAWKTVSGASIDGQTTNDKSGFLFKLQSADDGKYNIISGNGVSVSLTLTGWGSSTTVLETSSFETFTIANIGESTDHFYIQQTSNSAIADGNGSVVGWGTTAPTSTGGNNDHQFFEVTFTDVVDYSITPSNDKVYTISAENRGSWAYDPNYTVSEAAYAGVVSTGVSSVSVTDDNQKHFAILTSDGGHTYIYSIAAQKFVGADGSGAPLTDEPTTTTTQLYDNKSNSSSYPYVIIINDKHIGISNNYTDRGGVISFYNNLTDEGNKVRIVEAGDIDADVKAAALAKINAYETTAAINEAKATLNTAIAKAEGYTFGTAYGEYAKPENFDTQLTAAKAAVAAEDATVETLTAATSALNNVISAVAINVPKAGSFFRIKGKNSTKHYLAGENTTTEGKTTRAAFSETADASTIFYLDANSYLVNYGSGNYLCVNSNFAGYNGVQTGGTKFGFRANTCYTGSDGGAYNVTFSSGGRTLYAQDEYTDAAGSAGADNIRYTFDLEEVTTLPVAISAAGYATLYAPVALTIPENVKAYTVTMEETKAMLNEVEGTIPANTGVVLAGEEGTYNFTIASGETNATSALTGSIASTTVDANTSAYILAKGTQGVGFYLMNSESDRTIHGSRAYYNGGTQSTASAFIFDGTTTGIKALIDEAAADNAPIFDLSGRRVQKATKGVYIQNGKKVYVK